MAKKTKGPVAVLTPAQIEALPYRSNAGVVLVNGSGKIWAGRRLDGDRDAWQMPQGGIDAGETPREAALRELEEETGVTPDLVEIVAETPGWLKYELPHELVPNLWHGRWRGQKQKWFLMRFLGRDDQVTIETPDQEFSDWNWMSQEDLTARIVPFKRVVYQQIFETFAPLL